MYFWYGRKMVVILRKISVIHTLCPPNNVFLYQAVTLCV
ncbi:hypothetical protein ACVWXX_005776 [Bacillus toyonensis]|nr:hypothetical protein IGI_05476 [Bacillus toyonensis]EOP46255.1 hypothetical protein IKI_05209 [Bacillus toyonensis]